ncbi:MAG: phosphate ABC transporter permease subunit PstC [Anaerolineales bacterium]|jgi:phosphate transport system permease protein
MDRISETHLKPAFGVCQAIFSRQGKDRYVRNTFIFMAALPLFLILCIVAVLVVRALPIAYETSILDFVTGDTWSPLKGLFGLYPFVAGTLWVTALAMILSVPPCMLCAIYLSEYARQKVQTGVKPFIDLLAGIPSVIYGVWGMVAVVPFVQQIGSSRMGKSLEFIPFLESSNPTGFSVLAGGIVLAIMVAPVMISVICEVLQAVPKEMRLASLALGATHWQTIKYTVVPKAIPGIIASVVLGFSRAFGETIAVMMVIGNVPAIPSSIFDPAYPLTALIANNFGEMLSIPLYDAALMGAALVLLVVVLIFNLISVLILKIFKSRY